MIRKTAFVVALVALCVTSAYAAPDRTGKSDLGFNVSGAIPDDDDTDATVYLGGQYAYGVAPWLALGAEAGWAEFDDSEAGFTAEETAVPILGDIILRVPTESQAQFYGIVGLGVIVWNVDTNIPNVDFDVDTAFAAKFGGGVDWFVNDNWILNFEFSYITSDADATARNTVTGATISDTGETDLWMVGGGVKYLFS